MNNLQEKIEIIRAMEKGLTIQYSETDGEEDDWEDLKTTELDFDLSYYILDALRKGLKKDC